MALQCLKYEFLNKQNLTFLWQKKITIIYGGKKTQLGANFFGSNQYLPLVYKSREGLI